MVAIAGATGFVGRPLVADLVRDHAVVGMGRSVSDGRDTGGVEWRRCDLFSLSQLESALAGVDVAVYLVHSMMPSARLVQGDFADLDLLLADNFGRAAAARGVRRIVYLGGLLPPGEDLSAHLRSRREVESALGAHGVPVTSVRAGLVVGTGGSSLEILLKLTRRLPVMLCPRWTSSPTQPIALDDVVAILRHCIDDEATLGRICEVGGPDVVTYRELMQETARALGLRRLLIPVPLLTPKLSRLWVSTVTQTSRALVDPLIESLRHAMVVRDRWLQERMGQAGEPLRSALARAVEGATRAERASPPVPPRRRRLPPRAQSVQRLPVPEGWSATRVADEYMRWLPQLLRRVLRVERTGDVASFRLLHVRRPALELTFRPERSVATRAVFDVSGGWLARPEDLPLGRLEFRLTPDGHHVLSGVHDFPPRLPWWIYRASQALVHLWVMTRFGRHLERI